MSSQIRKYELKARAESQQETRDRIARAAAELHEEVGVARTTVAEIARRAGVTRLTVYNHFPDLPSLLPACTAHYETAHPAPELADALALPDAGERVTEALQRLYGWYRETEPMLGKLFSDRLLLPELDGWLTTSLDPLPQGLAGRLADSLRPRATEDQRALLRLAVDFWTWHRLTGDGLDDRAAAGLMAGAVLR